MRQSKPSALKSIISFFLRFVPRKYLQLFSHIGLQVLKVFYLGNKVQCPVCNSKYRKLLPYGRLVSRDNALCPNCLALERHRLLWLFFKSKTNFFDETLDVLHIAPELCFIDRFEKIHGEKYITADIESPLAKIKMDVHSIPYPEATFDVVFCNHVMEHVADDFKAMAEIHRVLRPGGWATLQIPLFHPLKDVTFEDSSITDPREREKAFGQDDHVRMYGRDYADRIRSVGFEVEESKFVEQLSIEDQTRYALPTDETIFYCIKPQSKT